jgi:hypothetical protein
MEGKPFRVGEYITAGKEKGYATTYEDSRTNKKVPLPGYTTINSIPKLTNVYASLITTGYIPLSKILDRLKSTSSISTP